MMYATHIIIAITAYLGLIVLGLPLSFDLGFAALIAGSIFPDIDHPHSLVSNFNVVTQFLSRGVERYSEHRKIVHSLIGAIVTTVIITVIALYFHLPLVFIFGFFFGYIMHLAADSLNPSGVGWL